MEKARIEVGGRTAAAVLVAVGHEVLDQRGGEPVVQVVALKAADKGDGHGSDQIGVFAVGLLAAAPAGIAGEVGIGSADDEASAVVALKDITRLDGFLVRCLLNEGRVPGLAQPCGLGNWVVGMAETPPMGSAPPGDLMPQRLSTARPWRPSNWPPERGWWRRSPRRGGRDAAH